VQGNAPFNGTMHNVVYASGGAGNSNPNANGYGDNNAGGMGDNSYNLGAGSWTPGDSYESGVTKSD
jgi:hypothetical protein